MNALSSIQAERSPGVLHATFPVPLEASEQTPGQRRIEGVAVPWNTRGRVSSGETVIFHPGSLDAAARPVVLRGHDRGQPIGRVADATDTGSELRASVGVSNIRLGDETLILAGDGALMFSVGADPTRYDYDSEGVMHVYAARWQELSLLPIGAYDGAIVTRVAAEEGDSDTDDDDEGDEEEGEQGEGEEEGEQGDADPVEAARPVPLAANRRPRRGRQRGRFEQVNLHELARVIQAARGGDARAIARRDQILAAQGTGIEAALADITLSVGTNNVGAMYRPAYQAELVDLIAWGTPLIDVLRQGDLERGDYPNKTFNRWETAPIVGIQVDEKTEITSGPAKITPASVPVETFAGGNDISQQTIDLGSPSFVEDYIRAAGLDYAKKTDTYAVTTLTAAATDVPTLAADSFIQVVGKLIGALSPATTPPGGLFMAVAYDVGVGLIGVPRDEGPAFWDGHVNFGRMTTEVTNDAGLTVFVDPNLAPRNYLAGHREGATWYDLPGTPFNLRAVNVGLLGLDVAIYGYAALGIQYPGAFVKTVQPTTP